jgi:hypothetical protein
VFEKLEVDEGGFGFGRWSPKSSETQSDEASEIT